jgi:hypothetical protein
MFLPVTLAMPVNPYRKQSQSRLRLRFSPTSELSKILDCYCLIAPPLEKDASDYASYQVNSESRRSADLPLQFEIINIQYEKFKVGCYNRYQRVIVSHISACYTFVRGKVKSEEAGISIILSIQSRRTSKVFLNCSGTYKYCTGM